MEVEPQPQSAGPAAEPDRAAAPPQSPGSPEAPAPIAGEFADGRSDRAIEPPPGSPLPPAAGLGLGWAVPTPAPAAPAGPVRTVVIPMVALAAAMLVAGWSAYRVKGPPSDDYAVGYLLGSIVSVLLVAGIALVIARKVIGRAFPARYRLIAAVTALVLTIMTSAASIGAAIRPPADPAAAMVIAAPYSLSPASAEIEQEFRAISDSGNQLVAVRLVTDETGTTVAILVATPGAQTPEFWAGLDRGFADAVGDGAVTPTTFHGQEAREVHGNGVAAMAWIGLDELLVVVYADSDAMALSVAEAQVRAVGTR